MDELDNIPCLEIAAVPWTALRAAREAGRTLVAFLPVGAVEAHGPHLPLATDGIIAHELASRAAQRLTGGRVLACLLPSLPYAPAEYARAFAGTLSIRPETLRALIVDLFRAIETDFAGLVVVNGHLEPDHVRNLRAACKEAESSRQKGKFIVCPEWTSEKYRKHLPEEFFRGGAHAGAYETSLVLAAEPSLVDEDARRELAAKPRDLAAAMKAGAKGFDEIEGGDLAYFGDPKTATAAQGNAVLDALAREVADEVRALVGGGA